jgi:formylglycine-generating enzyme required for sulfatase activity
MKKLIFIFLFLVLTLFCLIILLFYHLLTNLSTNNREEQPVVVQSHTTPSASVNTAIINREEQPVVVQSHRVLSVSMDMLWCKPGTFMMGSPVGEKGRKEDETQHEVILTQGFWLGKYEVTQGQWEKVMGSNPSHYKGETLPVEKVSWDDAMEFCKKLTQMEQAAGRLPAGHIYTLPTEAQWEYACRAGTTTAYSFSKATSNPKIDTVAPVVTLNGESVIQLAVGADYKDAGATVSDADEGDVLFYSSFDPQPNTLDVNGYMERGRDKRLDLLSFDQNGGLLALEPVGVNVFTDNITGLNGDSAFRAIIPEITRNDDYQMIFHGLFYAKEDGSYEFGADNADERCSFWIDLDQDETFESYGANGPEVIFTNFTGGGWKTHNLTAGYYRVAIGFMEYGGGAWLRPRVKLPGGFRLPINPSSPAQVGYWFASPKPALDVNIPGTYIIKYTATDSSGNVGTAQRAIIIREDLGKPLITLNGDYEITLKADATATYKDPGAMALDATGNVLKNNILGRGTVDLTRPGVYTLTYDYKDEQGNSMDPVFRKIIVVDFMIGGTITIYQANFNNLGIEIVGAYPSNAWGFHDMHGNVLEWCFDWHGDYPRGSASDPVGPSVGAERVGRGGSWNYSGGDIRSAGRSRRTPDYRNTYVGFRLSLQTAKAERP